MNSLVRVPHIHRSSTRLVVMLVVGLVCATATALLGEFILAAIVGWAAACVTYVLWVWLTVLRMDAATTASHATLEDPSRAVADILVVIASVASLAAIVILLVQSRSASDLERQQLAAIAFVSVALSWTLIHTLFTLRYASLYYWGEDGGIDFHQGQPPNYGDFAYLSFTLGMTYQVSDTNLQTHGLRMVALRHALLSYLFGAVILASMINLVAGLIR